MKLQENWLQGEFARAQNRRENIPPAARTTVVRPSESERSSSNTEQEGPSKRDVRSPGQRQDSMGR
jgi:hypothetical protein